MSGFSMITHTRPLSLQGRGKSQGLAAEQHPTPTSVEDHLNIATPKPAELYKVFVELVQTFGKVSIVPTQTPITIETISGVVGVLTPNEELRFSF
jgi:hypothetical protein